MIWRHVAENQSNTLSVAPKVNVTHLRTNQDTKFDVSPPISFFLHWRHHNVTHQGMRWPPETGSSEREPETMRDSSLTILRNSEELQDFTTRIKTPELLMDRENSLESRGNKQERQERRKSQNSNSRWQSRSVAWHILLLEHIVIVLNWDAARVCPSCWRGAMLHLLTWCKFGYSPTSLAITLQACL